MPGYVDTFLNYTLWNYTSSAPALGVGPWFLVSVHLGAWLRRRYKVMHDYYRKLITNDYYRFQSRWAFHRKIVTK
jgi:hypothetical protein